MFPDRWGLPHLALFWVVLVAYWAGFTFLTENGIGYHLSLAEIVVIAVPTAITAAEVHRVFTELWLERRRKQGQEEVVEAIKQVTPNDRWEEVQRYIADARKLLDKGEQKD